MIDEGYIKYQQEFIKTAPLSTDLITSINIYRTVLYKMKLIGAYDGNIGYGNISMKMSNNKFLISGTQTGQIPQLGAEHYTVIEKYNILENSLTCIGPIKASSESLTHAAIYELSPEIKAVIHVHSRELWDEHIDKMPTTKKEITYGTPEMALEVKRLYKEGLLDDNPIMIMAGHDEGIFTFGRDFEEAMRILQTLFKNN